MVVGQEEPPTENDEAPDPSPQAKNSQTPEKPLGYQNTPLVYTDPHTRLGPGDLVIITGNYPGADEGAVRKSGNKGPDLKQEWARTAEDFRLASEGRNTFMLAPTNPTNFKALASAINEAVKANKGQPFRRILLISHAGGGRDTPACKLSKEPNGDRLFFKSKSPAGERKNLPPEVAVAFANAIKSDGILVLASCGHCDDANHDNNSFLENVRGWAGTIGHAVYASAGPASPSISFGFQARDSETGELIPLIGFTSFGTRIPRTPLAPPDGSDPTLFPPAK